MTPDEIERWPKERSLLFVTGLYPAQLPLPDLSQWPAAADLVKGKTDYKEVISAITPESWVPDLPE